MKKLLPTQVSIEQVEIWFQRVGQKGTVTRVWALKGTRPRVVRQQQFKYAYIFGAVYPARDVAVGLVMPAVNSEAMKVHLQHIAAQILEGKHAILVLDRATWHTTKKLKIFPNITLMPLPPAELNPVEQVCQQLRDRELSNKSYDGYEDIVESSCNAWNHFVDVPNAIRQLCSREWAKINI